MIRISLITLAAASALAASGAAPARAQRAASSPTSEEAAQTEAVPPPPPGFPSPLGGDIVYGGELQTHLQSDIVSSTALGTRVSLFDDTNLTGFLNYRSWLSLNTEVKLERNRNDNLDSLYPDRNTLFRSEGVTLRQVFATVRPWSGLALYGGKIHPNFGSAYESAPGQYYNFASDYEQDERIGVGALYALPFRLGPELAGLTDLRVSVESFFLDTSVLSNSLLSRPGLDDPDANRLRRFKRDQFGPSNTGSLDSVTLALRGGRPGRGLDWQVSLTREATDEPGGRAEFGQSIGASYDPTGDGIPLGPRLGMTPFLEYTHFTNFAGIAGLERHYLVGGIDLLYGRWKASAAAGLRASRGAATDNEHQENLTLTYEILPRFQLGAGVNFINIAGRSSRALSPALSYTRAF